jgi:gliding motility-associated protein GldM
MAGGKLSARQKMINLMYLVFIAMLALNMSKKVLSSFGFMKEKLAASNVKVDNANKKILTNLAMKATEQPEKYLSLNERAQKLSNASNEFFEYLENVKKELTKKVEDPSDYEKMDNSAAGDEYFFFKGKHTKKGDEFVNNINSYREKVISLIGNNKELQDQIEKRFSTEDEKIGKTRHHDWLESRYEGFPLITTLTNIEQIQADIRTTETDIYNTLLGGQLESDVSMTNYDAMVVFEKSAYYSNERLKAKIVLGKNDPTLKASKVIINGSEVPESSIKAGQVIIDRSAGNVGEHELKGKFVFMENGKPVEIDIIGGKYSVIPRPNEAVISADKMNVVYRGLANPMTVSIPGISTNKISVRASSGKLTGSGGKYVMTPGQGKEVSITASAKMSDGKTVSSSKKFRVMDIPAPRGAIRNQTGQVGMPKASLGKASVGVILPDFVFDLTLRTTSFSIKVPGQATVKVNGARMNSKAQSAIARAKRGDVVSIFDIKSTLVGPGAGYRIKPASPVLVEIK